MANDGELIPDYEDEVSNDQMQSDLDFMTNEDLVDDFFDSLSMSENALAHIDSLHISKTAAASVSTTANDRMAWEASSRSSSQRSVPSSTPPSFGRRHNSPLSSAPRYRERSLSIPSSDQTSSSRDSCRGIKRKSPDNAFALSSRPEKSICCGENGDEEMEID